MKVLVACEESQRVCAAFREKGHWAFSCDIIPCSGGHPEWHIQQDVLPLLNGKCVFETSDGGIHLQDDKWDMIIAFPPCTYLCNTGHPFLNVEKYGEKAIQRYRLRDEAFEFFMKFANADCEKIAIENPVGYCNSHFRKPDQIIHPWMFGEPFDKKTCLWLKGLPKLIAQEKERPSDAKSYAWENMRGANGKILAYNSAEIKLLRSKTFLGVAKAMAEQWG